MARELHRIMGFGIVGGWALLTLLGGALALRRRDAGRAYWWLLNALQVALGAQLLAGLAVLASGGRPPLLHYVYGAVVPALLLAEAHVLTRRLDDLPRHTLFTIAALVNLFLAARALQTGLSP